ncbi:AAA family ATPase [Micromonospora sp. M12]
MRGSGPQPVRAGRRPASARTRRAGRELDVFDIVLERIARGRPERSLMLTGLRGVGKTVLLNTLRSQAINRLWGSGKIEARPDQSLRRPVAAALHMAVRELAPDTAPPTGSTRSSASSRRSPNGPPRPAGPVPPEAPRSVATRHRRAGGQWPGRLRGHRDRPGRVVQRRRRRGQ